MTPEERQLLTDLFDRVRTASTGPRDRDAEAFIADEVRNQPYSTYLLAQTVILQEQALRATSDQLQQLQAHVRDLEAAGARGGEPAGGSFLGGIGRSLFGGGEPPRPSPTQQPRGAVPISPAWNSPGPGQNPPGQQAWSQSPFGQPQQPQQPAYIPQPYPQAGPAPWGQPQQPSGGGSFLHGALGAAAGVAGGVLLADSLRGLFGGEGNRGAAGLGGLPAGNFGQPGGETIVNNYYGADQGNDSAANRDSDPFANNVPDNNTFQADYPDNQSFDDDNSDNSGSDGSFNV